MTDRMLLTIDGMSCGHCVRGVDDALKSLPGLDVEKVDIGSAVVTFDPAAVSPESIRTAIAEEGYDLRSMKAVS